MLTSEGFKKKSYLEYLAEMQAQAKELYGADLDLSDRSPLGQWIMLIANGRADESELQEQIWLSGHVDDSEGISLDHNAKRIGLSRIQAQKASGFVEFFVEANTSVPSGIILTTPGGIEFETTAGGDDLGGSTFITVPIRALVAGISGNVAALTIAEINTPIATILEVYNEAATTGGLDQESDSEFRERYFRSLANAGGASTPSIEAALLELPGVVDASVDENDQDIIVGGVPPNSIIPFIYGGLDVDIANAIFSRKTGGIRSFGTTNILVTDSKSKTHNIGFSRPTYIQVAVNVTLTKNTENPEYPLDGDAQIRTAIIKHIGGIDADAQKYNGQGLGADVIHYKVISAIAGIPGIDDVVVELSYDQDNMIFAQTNVPVGLTSIAQTLFDRVVIQ